MGNGCGLGLRGRCWDGDGGGSLCCGDRGNVVVGVRRRGGLGRGIVMKKSGGGRSGVVEGNTGIRKARMYTSGRRLSLVRREGGLKRKIGTEEGVYLICKGCNTAYLGNTIGIDRGGDVDVEVKCPVCTSVFKVDVNEVYVETLGDVVEDDKMKVGKIYYEMKMKKKIAENKRVAKKWMKKEGEMGCVHFGDCGGCSLNTTLDKPPVATGLARHFRKNLGYMGLFQMKIGQIEKWRTHAKLAVRGSVAKLGLYGRSSHKLVRIPGCLVHHPQINTAIQVLEDVFERFDVEGYNEDSYRGLARYVVYTVERTSGKVQLTLVWNTETGKEAAPFAQTVAKHLWTTYPDLWHSIYFNWNTARTNVILNTRNRTWFLKHGQPYIKENVLGVDLFFSPSTFIQANLTAFSDLLWEMLKHIPETVESAAELYCGTGTIGLVLAAKGRVSKLIASESNPACEGPWNQSAGIITRRFQKEGFRPPLLEFSVEQAEESIYTFDDVDMVVVDPPRKGLDLEVRQALVKAGRDPKSRLQTLVYVSCGVPSLKEDAEVLVKHGWSVQYASSWVLFPGSNHVETLCIMDAPEKQSARY